MDEFQGRYRRLRGPARLCQRGVLVVLPVVGGLYVLDVASALRVLVWKEQYLGLFLGLVLTAVFLGVVPGRSSSPDRLPWFDALLAGLGLACGLYLTVYFPSWSLGTKTSYEPYVGGLAILLALEGTRRLLGWTLVLIAVVFLFYARFAHLFPALLYNDGVSPSRLATYLYLDANGILGVALETGATMVLAFVLFGSMLFAAGGGQFFTELAQCLMGRFRGGPAKISVVASGLFGSINGSAVANVMVDGWITIPMMVKSGFRPHVAAAIEASASTGGIIMPPIMGAAAFLIAEFLGIPYAKVAIAAIVPAILYYVVLFVQVDLEAARLGLRGLRPEEIPSLRHVLKTGWVSMLALAAIFYTLFVQNMEPARAAMSVTLLLLLLAFLQRRGFGLRGLIDALEMTGRSLLDIGVITATAGIVIGVLSLMGLGFSLSGILVKLSGGNAFLLLLLAAVTCFVLGMGMPTTAAYVILAVLVVPAMGQLGVVPLAAHLFLLFFAKASMITPPVCLAAYAAASIAQSDAMKTGWTSTRLSLVTFVAPFVFAFSPALLLMGGLYEILLVVVTTLMGSVSLAVALSGFLYRPLPAAARFGLAAGGIGLILPPNAGLSLGWVVAINLVGGLLAAVIWAGEFRARRPPEGSALISDGVLAGGEKRVS